MREEIIRIAKENGADIVGFAPASRFDSSDPIFKIFPETKTVIGLAFRILRGTYRGVEEGSTYYQYTTMAVENMEETVMPMALLKVSGVVEPEAFVQDMEASFHHKFASKPQVIEGNMRALKRSMEEVQEG